MTQPEVQAPVAAESAATAPSARPNRQQRAPDAALLIYSGKLCTMYADHCGRPLIVVMPQQKAAFITDLYPLDMAFLFNEVRMFCEHYRVRNYTIRIHRRDWEFSQHCHLQVTMPRVAYDIILREIGVARPSSSQRPAQPRQPRPPQQPPQLLQPPLPQPDDRVPPPVPLPMLPQQPPPLLQPPLPQPDDRVPPSVPLPMLPPLPPGQDPPAPAVEVEPAGATPPNSPTHPTPAPPCA